MISHDPKPEDLRIASEIGNESLHFLLLDFCCGLDDFGNQVSYDGLVRCENRQTQ